MNATPPGPIEVARSPDGDVTGRQMSSRIRATLPAPWWLTVELTSRPGVRITSMDIRSFAIPLLESSDVVIAIDGRPVRSVEGFERYLGSLPPGAMVMFTVVRSRKTIDYAMLQMPDTRPPALEGARGEHRSGSGI